MKILVINGSPKNEKSNTLVLTKAFLEGICKKENPQIETIHINKMNIKDCLGCFYCWKEGMGKCCIKDDMESIIQKIIEFDIIIWSFPLYYFSLPSRIKAVMDRQLPMNLPFMCDDNSSGAHPSRYDMSNKRYIVISTCGFHTTFNNYNAVDEQFTRIYGQDGYTKIYCSQGELFNIPQLRNITNEYLMNIQRAGEEFAKGDISQETKELIDKSLYPKDIYEEMANASWKVEYKKDEKKFQQLDETYVFTKQMASLYNKNSWDKKDKVLEMSYTDLNKRYQIIMKKDGYEFLDKDFIEFTTKIETPFEVWKKISTGEIDGRVAMMEHKYKVKGDFSLMMNFDEHFGYNKSKPKKSADYEEKNSNMNLMLIPWIAIWVSISINPKIGAIIGIIISSLIPFLFNKYKPTIFEYLTIFFVNSISLLALNNYSINILIPISYLIFGLMWLITVFTKTPLTAYYSMSSFGGQEALANPLFLRTNKIITLYWALLYMVTPIWTYYLLNTNIGAFIGAINSICPFILGIFTNWFKNWYPKYYAQG